MDNDQIEKKHYWKDVENKNPTKEELKDEFKEGEFDSFTIKKSRRSFLKIMGFSFAASPLAGCVKIPVKKALPYLHKNDAVIPGVANWFATIGNELCHCSLLVKTREGRPIKIEGNPLSLHSRGGTCPVCQASVLSLYDSSRFKNPLVKGTESGWETADRLIVDELNKATSVGKDVVLVTPYLLSPSFHSLLKKIEQSHKNFKHVVFDAAENTSALNSAQEAYGSAVHPEYHFDGVRYVLGIEADFLGVWPNVAGVTRQYTSRRDLKDALLNKEMLRHVQVESVMTLTGANADVRVPLNPSEVRNFLINLVANIQKRAGEMVLPVGVRLPETNSTLVEKISEELWNTRGKNIIFCGLKDVSLMSLSQALNYLLGNDGTTVRYYKSDFAPSVDDAKFEQLVAQMEEGKVGAVFFWQSNPMFSYYNSKRLASALKNVGLKVSLGLSPDETSEECNVVAPANHFLESWGDRFVAPGELSFTQPTIQPLMNSRMAQESLMKWFAVPGDYFSFLKNSTRESFFHKQTGSLTFDGFFDQCLHDGVAKINMSSTPASFDKKVAALHFARAMKQVSSGKPLSLVGYSKVAMRDGRNANNPWLQEMPDPVTKNTWDNYFLVPPTVAKSMSLKSGDVIEVKTAKASLTLPVNIQPGMGENTLGVAMGYGRSVCGKVGKDVGANAASFFTYNNSSFSNQWEGVEIVKTGKFRELAATQTHHSMEGRDIVRETTLKDYVTNPRSGNENGQKIFSMWSKHDDKGHQWAMIIDLNKCTGCSGCVISCNAENNVPVVGREEVKNRREMHWMRLDRYYAGDENNPEVVHQPMLCQHCENAPCETVCPVLATVHSSDGLNQQVYNRCVGTRYCANNCPYKVRRFNWFDYPHDDKLENMVLNPDVAVRTRGVMEKCSLCVHRIQEGKLEAKKEGRELADGDIKLACQQSCPGDAILFGDLNDPKSKIAQFLKDPRNYRVLEELNVGPRVSYLTKVRNKD